MEIGRKSSVRGRGDGRQRLIKQTETRDQEIRQRRSKCEKNEMETYGETDDPTCLQVFMVRLLSDKVHYSNIPYLSVK